MLNRIKLTGLLLLMATVAGTATSAQAFPPASEYEHANDLFGRAVAADGDWAAVGAIGDNTAAFNAGAIYMYQRTGGTWSLHSRLVPEDSEGGTWLGNALALDGDTLLAGATVRNTGARYGGLGSARVYVRTGAGWQQQALLLPAPGASEDAFGVAVALAGDDAAIVRTDVILDGLVHPPAVHLFRRAGEAWHEAAVIPLAGRGSAQQVAFAGGLLVVSTQDLESKLLLYRRDGDAWLPTGEIDAAAAAAVSSDFGKYIAAHGDTLAISDGSRIALMRRDGETWTLQGEVLDADPSNTLSYQRNNPLALGDDHVAIGLINSTALTEEVHLFVHTGAGWTEDGVLVASDASQDPHLWHARYGSALAFAGDALFVGAMAAGSPESEESGVVYVYQRREAATWDETLVLAPEEPPEGCDCRSGPRDAGPLWVVLVALTGRRRRRTP